MSSTEAMGIEPLGTDDIDMALLRSEAEDVRRIAATSGTVDWAQEHDAGGTTHLYTRKSYKHVPLRELMVKPLASGDTDIFYTERIVGGMHDLLEYRDYYHLGATTSESYVLRTVQDIEVTFGKIVPMGELRVIDLPFVKAAEHELRPLLESILG